MVFHNSHLPLYRQVEDTLRKKIASGGLKEGDLLPSEQALAKEYGVSQGTVRKAVLDLTQKGILYRKQGKGTFVVFQRHNLGRYRNFRFVEELGSDLLGINISFLNLKVVSARAEIARNLQVRQGTKLIRLERLGKIADQFLFHTASYLPKRLYKGLEEFGAEEFIKNTLWKLQDIYFGMRIEKREEFISAIAADRKMAKTLDTDPGSPILRIEVKLTSFSGDVAEYRLSHCKLGGMKFHVSWDNV